jgi:phosphatidylserine/phosphatidylglycerophosphate/cardiolipin synthase-like enzyme
MPFEIRTFTNCDDATIVWRPDTFVPKCRGFALMRKTRDANGKESSEQPIETWMGFAGENWKSGDHKPSTEWPVQRYIWTDYDARKYSAVCYRVVPMVRTAGKLTPDTTNASQYTDWCQVGTGHTPGFNAYFNRGIVPAQFMARTLAQGPNGLSPTKYLGQLLSSVTGGEVTPTRVFLGGRLRKELLALLTDAAQKDYKVYAALYELNDPELIPAMEAIGRNFSLILASGAYKAANRKNNKPAVPDENAATRKALKKDKKVNVFDRVVGSPHFAHHKFMVFCDANDKPLMVWTGSTNTTITGLCTQVNNGILIDSPELAACFKRQWDLLKKARNEYPSWLMADDTTPTHQKISAGQNTVDVTVWHAPTNGLVDLNDAKRLIQGARQGVLFLMFNPGPQNSLLNEIIALDADRLFVHGVVNQDPGGSKAPVLALVDRGTPIHTDPEVVLPAEISSAMEPALDTESRFNAVMIHSKVVVIDPFGPHPVVITGSHNLGPKASGKNDDNMVIIENAPGLAAEYAVNILGVYGHYKWRHNMNMRRKAQAAEKGAAVKKGTKETVAAKKAGGSPAKGKWQGLEDTDQWQHDYMTGDHLREIDFWFGRLTTALPEMTVHGRADASNTRARAAKSHIRMKSLQTNGTNPAARQRKLKADVAKMDREA